MLTVGQVPMLVLCGLPIFVILFVTIATALKHSSTYGKNASTVIALCVSLLCVAGMYRTFFPASGSRRPLGVDLVLLSYTVLGIAVLVLSLLMFVAKLVRRDKPRKTLREVVRRTESMYGLKYRRGR